MVVKTREWLLSQLFDVIRVEESVLEDLGTLVKLLALLFELAGAHGALVVQNEIPSAFVVAVPPVL